MFGQTTCSCLYYMCTIKVAWFQLTMPHGMWWQTCLHIRVLPADSRERESIHIMSWLFIYFYVATFFLYGIRTWLFATQTCKNQWWFVILPTGHVTAGGLLVVLIFWLEKVQYWSQYSTKTRAVPIMNVSPGINISYAGFFNFCLFFSWYWRAKCLILSGELNMTWFNTLLKRTKRFSCAHCDFVMNIHWFLFPCRNFCLSFYWSCFSALCNTCSFSGKAAFSLF